MNLLSKWISSIITVMIFISFIEILMPNSRMKKYLNLILGFIVIIVILNPLISLLNSEDVLEDEFYKISGLLDREEYIFAAKNIEILQKEQFMMLYKDRLKDDIKTRIERKYEVKVLGIDIVLEKDDHREMGKIKKLYLSIIKNQDKKGEAETIPIIKIDICDNEKKDNNIDSNNIDISLRDKIRHDISVIYNINNNDVTVN